MPNSRHSGAIFSQAAALSTNSIFRLMVRCSFHGIRHETRQRCTGPETVNHVPAPDHTERDPRHGGGRDAEDAGEARRTAEKCSAFWRISQVSTGELAAEVLWIGD